MNKKLLPLGSVVLLEGGNIPGLSISRQPILNLKSGVCYFDYGAVNQLTGLANDQAIYFNHEDIRQIMFEGYVGSNEESIQKSMLEWLADNPHISKGSVDDF